MGSHLMTGQEEEEGSREVVNVSTLLVLIGIHSKAFDKWGQVTEQLKLLGNRLGVQALHSGGNNGLILMGLIYFGS